MADKMKNIKQEKDELIISLIESDQPLEVPAGMLGEIMDKIKALAPNPAFRPFLPPKWLRWGIPAVFAASFLASIIAGSITPGKSIRLPDLSNSGEFLIKLNQWLGAISKEIKLPEISVPDNLVWITIGSLALLWGFFLLNRFLELKTRK
jgi:hypothetical protein